MGVASLVVEPTLLCDALNLLPPGVKVVGSYQNTYGRVDLAIQSEHLADGAVMRLKVCTTPLSIFVELEKVS